MAAIANHSWSEFWVISDKLLGQGELTKLKEPKIGYFYMFSNLLVTNIPNT
ncbi:MAG: hypothetical protein HC796_04915 [Synechococcaceae cyanobacterium RL_1_2]|nr:hypothetical protein [Synechococcaceae cyanobacterium RL_1_2]